MQFHCLRNKIKTTIYVVRFYNVWKIVYEEYGLLSFTQPEFLFWYNCTVLVYAATVKKPACFTLALRSTVHLRVYESSLSLRSFLIYPIIVHRSAITHFCVSLSSKIYRLKNSETILSRFDHGKTTFSFYS